MDKWKAEVVRVNEEKRREEKRREEKRRGEERRGEERRGEKRREEGRRKKKEERRSKKRKPQKRESLKKEKVSEERRSRRKKIEVREKVEKSRNTVCFQCGSGGSKSRLAKAAGAEPAGQMRYAKLHAVVARSTFANEKAKNTSRSGHFLKLRCRKSARRYGAKHISKSKCTKHTRSGPLLEVEMSKKCTPLWREAHFEVKMYKTTFGSCDVEKVYAVVARSTYRSQKCKKLLGYGALLDVQMCFRVAGARDCGPCQKWAKREGL